MADVDLAQFQFDYDLTWAAMFMNADGTVYGRFGMRSIEGAMAHISVDALKNAMSRALDLRRIPGERRVIRRQARSRPSVEAGAGHPRAETALRGTVGRADRAQGLHSLSQRARRLE